MKETMRRIAFCRYGYADVPAKTDEEAFEAAKKISEHEIDWEPFSEDVKESVSIVEVFERDEES